MIDTPPKRAAERIRETAHALFYDKGVRAVGVDEIVRRSGVTKPTLYRAFASKDDLIADYVAAWTSGFTDRFEAALAEHPDDVRAGILAWFKREASRAGKASYRGCAASNVAVEHPEKEHQARAALLVHKARMRERLKALAREMGARKPGQLGDGLFLLMEGVFASGQQFDEDGPADNARKAAAALIDAYVLDEQDIVSYLRT